MPRPLPQQIEFARLNLSYVVLSKRKLIQLVEENHVAGWDDPRMPTLVGARRRGYTPEGFRRFAERIGVSKSDSWIDMSVLEDCMREDLNERAQRRIAVLDPLKLVIDNYPAGKEEECFAPNHPQQPELGKRAVPFSRELWIEREDFMETPSRAISACFPGNSVRLRYGFVVKCTGCDKDAEGKVSAVHCEYYARLEIRGRRAPIATRSRATCTGSRRRMPTRPKCAALRPLVQGRAYPGAGERDFLLDLNPDSKTGGSPLLRRNGAAAGQSRGALPVRFS